jgi:pimeloyl-ACP methyl ester carboxylesterase
MGEVFAVPVPGGDLEVHRWPADRPEAPVVLATHGITANGLSWATVAARLAGSVTLLAPDLRGRAGSGAVPGPYGIARHADDLIAVLDRLGVERAVLAGHSMGGFVACLAAVRQPARVTSLVLVDGGVGFATPPGVTVDEALTAVIGPAMRRLSMTFETRQAYREYWQAHPALAGDWSPEVDGYVQHDLAGTEPALRSSCSLDAVRADGSDLISDPDAREAIRRLPVPAVLLWASRGLMNEAQGLYDAQRLRAANLDPAVVSTAEVPDTNHYTVLVGTGGAEAVARRLRAAAG